MLEVVAAQRLGIAPAAVDGFGVKVNIARITGLGGPGTIEADLLLKNGVFYDMKWTSGLEIDSSLISSDQLSTLEAVLSDPNPPIAQAVFATNRDVTQSLRNTIAEANSRIRDARGLPASSPDPIALAIVGDLR